MEQVRGTWRFNAEVAARFDREARMHIPNYEAVVGKCVDIASGLYQDKTAPKIIDIGCATGYTLERLLEAGFTNVYGVDNSQAMLDRSRVRERLILSDTLPTEHGPYHVVLANWTLHFIDEREKYLADISASLMRGGLLVLTEKMDMGPLVYSQYLDFKRAQGVSEEEIIRKEAAIQGVLTTKSLTWYLNTLESLGFRDINTLDAAHGFVSLVAHK